MKLALPQWLNMEKKISLLEYKKMKLFMEKHDIWRYKIKQNDFYRIRDGKRIVAFWRLFKIGFQQLELWSIRVDESHRGKKLWLIISQELITDKRWKMIFFLQPEDHWDNITKKYDLPSQPKISPKNLPLQSNEQ